MNFLVDEQLPPALVKWLQRRGYIAAHVSNFIEAGADDRIIAQRCREQDMILLTKDRDFAERHADGRLQIVWFRWGNIGNPLFFPLIDYAWQDIEQRLRAGDRIIEID